MRRGHSAEARTSPWVATGEIRRPRRRSRQAPDDLGSRRDHTGGAEVLTASYTFLSFFWDVLLFFAWLIWFWLLITVFADLFRRHDESGWTKAAWIVFVILLPYVGVLVYLIAEHKGMEERNAQRAQAAQQQFELYVQSVARSDPSEQIARAKTLLDNGSITQAEFDQIKRKALV